MDATTIGIIAGAAGTIAGAAFAHLNARVKRGEREDSALARVLERRDEDCRRLGERYDAARSAAELHAGQIGDLAARAEAAIARCEEYAERVDKLERENALVHAENASLRARVTKLERERGHVTPANDTPAVKRAEPMRPPALPSMHESVGGYRYGK